MKQFFTYFLIVFILLGLFALIYYPYLRDGEEIIGYSEHGVPIKRKELNWIRRLKEYTKKQQLK